MSEAPTFISVVCGIVEKNGRILLAQKPPTHRLAGLWEFPGGKPEPGESGPEAIRRELMEELSLRVEVSNAGPAVQHHYDWGLCIELTPYLCQCAEAEAEPQNHEHSALRWVTSEELMQLPLAPADVPIARWYLAR